MATATERYKVVRAFERWEGRALRKYARGTILSPKDAAKLDIQDKKKYPRGNPLHTLVNSGAILRLPDEEPIKTATEVTADGRPDT